MENEYKVPDNTDGINCNDQMSYSKDHFVLPSFD